MSCPATVDELIDLVRKSGMVDDPRLNDYLAVRSSPPGGTGADAVQHLASDMVRDGLLTEFQKDQFLLGKWRGFTIGKYKLLERIGVGGMGQVFLGEHMFMRRRVAIKVLPPAKAEQPSALGRFYREARAAALLEHPNVVRTHDIDQDGNLHFIVMEHVFGTNLLDVVRKFGPIDIGRAVSYVRQVADGLQYAFRNNIVHRDVKPGNILVDRRGRAKILDLGLARFNNDTTDNLTVKYDDKIVLGTADYVAPEQVANSHEVDVRADVYALGATFYFLLAGHPPFPNGTVSQKLLWHRTKEPTPIRDLRPEVPDGLAAILARMMAKDPSQRYQTPAEVSAELAAWLPANVALPAPEEMPTYCRAVTEGLPPDSDELMPADVEAMTAHGSFHGAQNPPSPVPASRLLAAGVPSSGLISAPSANRRSTAGPFSAVATDPWASPTATTSKTAPQSLSRRPGFEPDPHPSGGSFVALIAAKQSPPLYLILAAIAAVVGLGLVVWAAVQ